MKTKALISFAVTAKLICAFVFAYAKKNGFLTTRLISFLGWGLSSGASVVARSGIDGDGTEIRRPAERHQGHNVNWRPVCRSTGIGILRMR